MHDAAFNYVRDQFLEHGPWATVIEFGSRNINGGVRELFNGVDFLGIDVREGEGVDLVADAATVEVGPVDCVICTEVLEHADNAEQIIANAYRSLNRGGVFIMTCGGPGRHEHSAIDGLGLQPGEFYRNVDAETLSEWLERAGFSEYGIDQASLDMRCIAWR